MSDDKFDDIPDDFADVQDVDWAQLLAGPSTSHAPNTLRHPESLEETSTIQETTNHSNPSLDANDSSSYFSDDGIDSGFLAELDRLEETLTHASPVVLSNTVGTPAAQITINASSSESDRRGSTFAPQPQSHRPSQPQSSRYFTDSAVSASSLNNQPKWNEKSEIASNVSRKRPRSERSPERIQPGSKGKSKAVDSFQQIISGYEDELTCPICCDLFVASHIGNPCGHTFCGDCGWQWYFHTADKTCPCCRTTLDESTPMFPNISMDNTVEKHVKALALSGLHEWEPGGRKHGEWIARKQAWLDGAKSRQKKKSRQAARTPSVRLTFLDMPDNWFQVQDNVEQDPTYFEETDVELVPRPVRRAQRRSRNRR